MRSLRPDDTPAGEISHAAGQLLTKYTGRNGTRTRTSIDRDAVMIMIADPLSAGEQALVNEGMGEHVLRTRRQYQKAMREDLIEAVEGTLDRTVIAFMSDNHIDPDVSADVFLLEPGDQP